MVKICCPTHDTRDELALANGETPRFAEIEDFQCRCTFGLQCKRRATDEDFRCDWCRDIEAGHVNQEGHQLWWNSHNGSRRSTGYRGYYEYYEREWVEPAPTFAPLPKLQFTISGSPEPPEVRVSWVLPPEEGSTP